MIQILKYEEQSYHNRQGEIKDYHIFSALPLTARNHLRLISMT